MTHDLSIGVRTGGGHWGQFDLPAQTSFMESYETISNTIIGIISVGLVPPPKENSYLHLCFPRIFI